MITTHYMEEAVKADRIGFMRNGCIILEGPPSQIKEKSQVSTLDDVFLGLCQDKEIFNNNHLSDYLVKYLDNKNEETQRQMEVSKRARGTCS